MKMRRNTNADLNYYRMMIVKPFLELRPGAYACMGQHVERSTSDELCRMVIESPYTTESKR
jgi:hypothetical protein